MVCDCGLQFVAFLHVFIPASAGTPPVQHARHGRRTLSTGVSPTCCLTESQHSVLCLLTPAEHLSSMLTEPLESGARQAGAKDTVYRCPN